MAPKKNDYLSNKKKIKVNMLIVLNSRTSGVSKKHSKSRLKYCLASFNLKVKLEKM